MFEWRRDILGSCLDRRITSPIGQLLEPSRNFGRPESVGAHNGWTFSGIEGTSFIMAWVGELVVIEVV